MPKILVVEDDPRGRYLVCEVLRREGYEVAEAADGTEALEILLTERVHLVITDFVMPKLNGFEFLQQLHSINPQIPVIFVTGYLSVVSETLLQDVAEIIRKPFEFEALRSAVKRALTPSARA
jgi:two-component system response regulator (stage 0 sporulation protein F)